MNCYIVDPDEHFIEVLTNLLEKNIAYSVVGSDTNSFTAYDKVLRANNIDLVFINSDIADNSPTRFINNIRQFHPLVHFIMVSTSTATSKKTHAYNSGIDFYLSQPINTAEVNRVCALIAQNIELSSKIRNISRIINGGSRQNGQNEAKGRRERVISLLRYLGISSQTGVEDILMVVDHMLEYHIDFGSINFEKAFKVDKKQKKVIFQRIRRAIRTGLKNLASIYRDEPGNEILVEYANSLYDFNSLRKEVNRKPGDPNSRVSVHKFFDGLMQESL